MRHSSRKPDRQEQRSSPRTEEFAENTRVRREQKSSPRTEEFAEIRKVCREQKSLPRTEEFAEDRGPPRSVRRFLTEPQEREKIIAKGSKV